MLQRYRSSVVLHYELVREFIVVKQFLKRSKPKIVSANKGQITMMSFCEVTKQKEDELREEFLRDIVKLSP